MAQPLEFERTVLFHHGGWSGLGLVWGFSDYEAKIYTGGKSICSYNFTVAHSRAKQYNTTTVVNES